MNVILSTFKFIFIDIIGDFVIWPFWWYTVGLKDRLIYIGEQAKITWMNLGLNIWLKNIFVPMYGDKSLIGRLISFFARVVVLVFRLLVFVFWMCLVLITLIIWIALPVAVIWFLSGHFKIK